MPSPVDPSEYRGPRDGSEFVDPQRRFSRDCLAAVREFRRSKPWRGTVAEREEKFRSLHAALCEAYGLEPPPGLEFVRIDDPRVQQARTGGYDRRNRCIVVAGKLSVSTYLWALARARGLAPEEAFRFAFSLFARMFPRSFARCRFEGMKLVNDGCQIEGEPEQTD